MTTTATTPTIAETMTTNIAGKGTQGGKRMWPSLQTADWLFSASNIALIVGLALTVVATIGAVWMANVRETYLKRELSEASTKVEEARSESAKANAEAARANEAAAEANRIAEGERLARIKIEERLADRFVSDEQYLEFANALRGFAGQEYEVTTFWDLREPMALSNRVSHALVLAGWKFIPLTEGRWLLGALEGIEVYVHPEASERTRAAVDALVGALNTLGLAAKLKQKNVPDNPDNIVSLNIGTMP